LNAAPRKAAATVASTPVMPGTPEYWDDACKHLAKRDRVLKRLIPQFGEARLASRGDAFTTLARSIVGQQISVKAAQAVWDRFAAAVGGPSTHLSPDAVLALAVADQRAAASRSASASTWATWPRASPMAACTPRSGRRWMTRPSSKSWWPCVASAAGRRRCS
jgi:hypothetical protein